MSEASTPFADSVSGSMPSVAPVTAGAMLRAAREQAGLHIAALAVALKIPVRKLELLESDRYDELPGAVFIRALASSVCRTLKIDPKEILIRLPASHAPALSTDNGGLDPFRPAGAHASSTAQQISKPVIVAVLILLLAALVLIFMPSINRTASAPESAVSVITPPNDPAATPSPPAVATMSPGTGPAETFAPPEPGSTTPAASSSDPAAAAALTNKPSPQSTSANPSKTGLAPVPATAATTASAASAASAATAAAATSSPAAVPTNGIVSFAASGQSWIQVTDAKGTVALETILNAGQTAAANGTPPLKVIVGRADATQISVRGKSFDATPYSRDNVARFEVK